MGKSFCKKLKVKIAITRIDCDGSAIFIFFGKASSEMLALDGWVWYTIKGEDEQDFLS